MVICQNAECSEYGVEVSTTALDEYYGTTGYPVTCGGCGRPAEWPADTPPADGGTDG